MKKVIISLVLLCFIITSSFWGIRRTAAAEKDVNISIGAEISLHAIEVGSTTKINATATADGKKLKDILYISEDKKVATVNKEGIIKGIKAGECQIKVYPKGYKDNYTYIWLKVVDRIIKITGPSTYKAGHIYQLKASEKHVIWGMYNLEENTNASIDAATGKVKIRSAGEIYVFCTSKDKKGFGGAYITAKGPIIENKTYTLDPIVFTKDEHIVSLTELEATGKLPVKMKVPYKDGNKKGKVEVSIKWDDFPDLEYDEGSCKIYGDIQAPDRYYVRGHCEITVNFKKAQTDNRVKIVSIKAIKPITISKDEHIIDYWDIKTKYFSDTKLECELEDGSVVKLPIESISYREEMYGKKGTYECKLIPRKTPGYDMGGYDGPSAKLVVKITAKQTGIEFVNTLDTIALMVYVLVPESQKPLSK